MGGENLWKQTIANRQYVSRELFASQGHFSPTNKNPSKSVITAKVWVAPPAPQKHQQKKSEDPRESVKKCQQSDRSFYD
ncbi:unnamed protein product [Brugia pahangi]|uniref:Ovule protein n=1 Tax=Brugia pahangi TaxID=6280 RepID=A0A0N4TSU9_BRUPA|nr:unnamed protein product [Brugia pahangi]